ncbi:LPXTG cell wall anchor domain-containing protein [Clostridium folliculivorans]|uniref:Gram-positive cocci surface proteins LPxTG domain-containing protein n=1 Tax=Clostridium folliculivorans TaxID=2886038 RepID=A0A9W5Y1U4_9CLOT|nr:LPXTG cell wall anchor domain-containing protein [Clostridium folliculivorans]GKU24967.1 hypothetical protein CFOLD11_17930 [Clostridium folliculivorans]GKU31065.1 hypothetical protein CFB3_31720 [Clostridium folliculivorans]
MKKRKNFSIAILVMFLVQLIFGMGVSKEVKAEEVNSSVPQFLDIRKETVDFAYQYKDKTIINNAVIIDNNIKFYVEENGKKHIISEDFNLIRFLDFIGIYNDNAYVVSNQDNKRSIYKVDLNTYKMEYVKEVPSYKDGQAYITHIIIDSNGVFWYEAEEHNIPIYDSNGRILDNKAKDIIFNDKGFSFEAEKIQKGDQNYDSFGGLIEASDGSMWFSRTVTSGTDNKVYKISNGKIEKEYLVNSAVPMAIYEICPGDDNTLTFIAGKLGKITDGRITEEKMLVQKYKINNDTLQLVKEFEFPTTYFFATIDINRNVWISQNGDIFKLEGNELQKKYVVDNFMKPIKVYDDKHMVAYGIVGMGYTPISISDPAEKPLDNNNTNTSQNSGTNSGNNTVSSNNGTTANNNSTPQDTNKEKFNVDVKGTNAVLTLDSKQISKDSENTVVPTLASSVQTIETKFDALTTNGGKGSVKVNANNVSLVLPFSTIDYTGVNNGDYVKFSEAIVKNDYSLSSIKDIGKLFDFSLGIYRQDGTKLKDIHSFKNGKATISVKITNDEIKNLDINKLSAFYYNENNKSWENVGGSYNKETMTFTFQASHFSKYTIAQINGTLPQTGAVIDSTGIMLAALILILMGSTVLMRRNISRIKTSNR